MTEGLTFQYS